MRERTRFENESSSLGLRDYDQTPPGAGIQEFVVGEPVEFDLAQFGLGSTLVEKVRWQIPGRIVYSYSGDANSTLLVDFDKKYFSSNSVKFYWVDAQDNRTVVCNATTVNGRERVPVKVKRRLHVKGPKLTRFAAKTSKAKIVSGRGGTTRISFGERQTNAPGISWDCKIEFPKNFGGRFKDLQLVKQGRKKQQLLEMGGKDQRQLVRGDAYPNKNFLLDIGTMADEECRPDRAAADPKYSQITKVSGGESLTFDSATDSPSDQLLPLDITFSVNESFRYFLLFKPDKPGAIWVPVGVANWYWKAEARKEKSEWKIVSRYGGLKGGKGRATSEFPVYSGNACDIPWT